MDCNLIFFIASGLQAIIFLVFILNNTWKQRFTYGVVWITKTL